MKKTSLAILIASLLSLCLLSTACNVATPERLITDAGDGNSSKKRAYNNVGRRAGVSCDYCIGPVVGDGVFYTHRRCLSAGVAYVCTSSGQQTQ